MLETRRPWAVLEAKVGMTEMDGKCSLSILGRRAGINGIGVEKIDILKSCSVAELKNVLVNLFFEPKKRENDLVS